MSLFKNRIYECFNVNFFKSKVSDRMSAKGAHVQGACGSESTNSPASSSLHSLIIDTEYVFISKYNYYLRYYIVNGYCQSYYFYEFFFKVKFCITHDIDLTKIFIYFFNFIFFLMGTNQGESYFTTSSYENTTC